MAQANLVLPDGTKVAIDGSADEVAALLERFSTAGDHHPTAKRGSSRRGRGTAKGTATKSAKKAIGPTDYIRELISEGYFKTKREIGPVRDKLEERAHIYPVTSISGPLFRLVKKKELRRLKEDGAWKYVNP
jgi:hypothetical protein